MDYSPYYVPQSIAPILANSSRTLDQKESVPSGLEALLPAIGNVAQAGFNVAANNQKKQSIMAAQQVYSDYLTKVDSGQASNQDHARGRMAALALGITPPSPLDIAYKQSTISRNNAQASAANATANQKNNPGYLSIEDSNAIRKKLGMPASDQPIAAKDIPGLRLAAPSASADQQLNPQEMQALKQAALRQNNPLPVSLVNFKGPRAKIIAQSLMQDPNWSPTGGEASLSGARAGASAAATLNSGGQAQQSARAANTVIQLTDGLQQASNEYSRADARFLNVPINAINQQSGTQAMKFKQYLVDTRSKMATALQGGGVPQAEAQKVISDNFPDTMTAAQVPAAIENIKNIMRTQIKGALTPVTASMGNSPQTMQVGRFQVQAQ